MDEGLKLLDVLVVVLDYLSWWNWGFMEIKVAVEDIAYFFGYTVIQW